MNDIALLIQLKLRHAKTVFVMVAAGLIGSDIVAEKNAGERMYQIYVAALVFGAAALLWLAALDFTSTAFSSFGVLTTATLFQASLFIFPMIFIIGAVSNIRSCAIKLTTPDIAYIAFSPIKTSSLVISSVLGQCLAYLLPLLLTGYMFGECLISGLGLSAYISNTLVVAIASSLLCVILVFCSVLASMNVGLLRVMIFSKENASGQSVKSRQSAKSGRCVKIHPILIYFMAFLLFVVMVIGLSMLIIGGSLANEILIAGLFSEQLFPLCLILLVCLAILLVLLVFMAKYVYVTDVIDRNAFYVQTYTLRLGLLYGLEGLKTVRRQRRIAARGPIFKLPIKIGSAALISRSAISHLRQFEGIPGMLLWGAYAAPLAAFLFSGASLPVIDLAMLPAETTIDMTSVKLFMWVVWIMLVLVNSGGLKEMARPFNADMKNIAVRNRLPFSTTKIFMLEIMPSFLLVSLISLAVTTLMWSGLEILPWLLIYSVLLNIILVLCAALDGLKMVGLQRAYSYELTLIVSILVLFIVSLAGSLLITLAGLIFCIITLVLLMQSSAN